jgi:hypothetical protein
VRIAERDGGRLDERGVGADGEQSQSARRRLIGWQRENLALFSPGRERRILATR